MELDSNARARFATAVEEQSLTATRIWSVVRGELPEEVVADDLLTPEDYRDLTLDHIARTCEVVVTGPDPQVGLTSRDRLAKLKKPRE